MLSVTGGGPLKTMSQITPDTLAEACSQREQYGSLLSPVDGLFLCTSVGVDFSGKRVWVIDGEDTLWEDNIYYERIAQTFAEQMLKTFYKHKSIVWKMNNEHE